MKQEQVVGTRLPDTVVRDLETIEQVEQADRSTTVRKLLSRAIQDWKLDHYSRLYGQRQGHAGARLLVRRESHFGK